jgi:hypothetical protein
MATRKKKPQEQETKTEVVEQETEEMSRSSRVKALLDRVGQTLEQGELKPSLADYIRLMQFERELTEEEPRNVEVRWVEKLEEESDSGR